MKEGKQKFWVVATLSILPVPLFAGYRMWMRKRSKTYWKQSDPAKMYYYLTRSLPPAGREFVTEEVEDMSKQMAARETPFWGVNYVTPMSHEQYIADLEIELPLSGAIEPAKESGTE